MSSGMGSCNSQAQAVGHSRLGTRREVSTSTYDISTVENALRWNFSLGYHANQVLTT